MKQAHSEAHARRQAHAHARRQARAAEARLADLLRRQDRRHDADA